jgi:HK97 gp10 family phage protein
MPITFDNSGFLKVRANIRNNVPDALLKGANDIVKLASELAPKETEALSQSGQAVLTGNRTVEITFGNGLPDDRAQAQEYGTSIMPAQPYLTPAMRAVDLLKYVKEAIFSG